jgi:hypothetical protein
MLRVEIAWNTPGVPMTVFPFASVLLELILFLMNLTLPSDIVALTPPGWLLFGARLLKAVELGGKSESVMPWEGCPTNRNGLHPLLSGM